MALSQLAPVVPVSVAVSLPDTVVTNEDLAARFETSSAWIERKTGIRTRRYLRPDEDLLDHAERAAREALRGAELLPQHVDVLIVATSTPDWAMPSLGVQLASRMGIETPHIVDLTQYACASAVYGIRAASLFLQEPGQRHALVVCPEASSRALDPADRLTRVFFGDAAGATVLSRCDEGGLVAYDLGHSESFGVSLPTNIGLDRRRVRGESDPSPYLFMDGPAVWSEATTALPKSINECLGSLGVGANDVQGYALHQANIRLIEHVVADLGVSPERVAITADTLGNTAAASPLTAFARLGATGRARAGDLVVMAAIGAGFMWGTLAFRLDRDLVAKEMCE